MSGGLTPECIKLIKDALDDTYRDVDIAAAIDYFRKFFVETCPIPVEDLEDTIIGDFGCGYGFLAFAFALNTPARIVAMDIDADRVKTGQKLAIMLGVDDRVSFQQGSVTEIPLSDLSIDIGYTIEALEHIDGDKSAFSELTRVCRHYIVATTPNRWFPLIAHDTRLPFCHWLPMPLRTFYAKLTGREDLQHGNRFWSESDFKRGLTGFQRRPGFMQFDSADDYINQYPTYLPYDGGSMRGMGKAKRLYCKLASNLLGAYPSAVLPNLSGIWQRLEK